MKKIYALLPTGETACFESPKQTIDALGLKKTGFWECINGDIVHTHGIKLSRVEGKFNDKPMIFQEQKLGLANKKRLEYAIDRKKTMLEKGKKSCTICNLEKDLSHFYFVKKENTYHSNCKECWHKKHSNSNNEYGRCLYFRQENKELAKQNKRKCYKCFVIKDISEFYKASKSPCKECQNEHLKSCRDKGRENLSETYINRIISHKHSLPVALITNELREITKLELLISKEIKRAYEYDGQRFSQVEFARYLNKKYGIGIGRTQLRIIRGEATVEECLLNRKEYQQIKKLKNEERLKIS